MSCLQQGKEKSADVFIENVYARKIESGLMIEKSNKVIDLHEYIEKRKILSLYERHEGQSLETLDPMEYSTLGLRLLDEAMFFLKHPDLQDQFEQEFMAHMKNFAISHLKQR